MPQVKIGPHSLHYEERGQGMPVVLVHGFPLDRRIWQAQLEGLSDAFRIVVPDLRGFGQSTSDATFTLEALADDLHAFLHQIFAAPCVLGGLSMGGYVVFEHLVKYPTDLCGLMLVDTKCEADTDETKANRLRMANAARSGGARAVADMMEAKMTSPTTCRQNPKVVERLRQIMDSQSPQTLEYASLAMRDRPDYRERLASIACPTLIIVGQDDAFAPPPTAEGMKREIPHSELVEIADAGHLAPMEQPDEVNRTMRRFLSSISRQQPASTTESR